MEMVLQRHLQVLKMDVVTGEEDNQVKGLAPKPEAGKENVKCQT
jgi:hypothetical protein